MLVGAVNNFKQSWWAPPRRAHGEQPLTLGKQLGAQESGLRGPGGAAQGSAENLFQEVLQSPGRRPSLVCVQSVVSVHVVHTHKWVWAHVCLCAVMRACMGVQAYERPCPLGFGGTLGWRLHGVPAIVFTRCVTLCLVAGGGCSWTPSPCTPKGTPVLPSGQLTCRHRSSLALTSGLLEGAAGWMGRSSRKPWGRSRVPRGAGRGLWASLGQASGQGDG